MKRKTTRLTFTEEELANPKVRHAAKKATRAADRADKAKAKLSTRAPPKRGLKMDADKAKERSAQLRFGKAEFSEEIAKPKRRTPTRPKSEAPSSASARRNSVRRSPNPSAASRARKRCWAAKHTARWTNRIRMKTPACRLPMRGNAWPKVQPRS